MADRRAPVGWAEQRGQQRQDWVYDPVAVRRAMAIRRVFNPDRNKHKVNAAGNAARTEIAQLELERARRADSLEQAKAFLARTMPVYSAAVVGGRADLIMVGGRLMTAEEVQATARRKGWRGDGEVQKRTAAPPKYATEEITRPPHANGSETQDETGAPLGMGAGERASRQEHPAMTASPNATAAPAAFSVDALLDAPAPAAPGNITPPPMF